ncbi:uncharacterized protein LOC5520216 [Nematostella vectensis]|uniref:uncharacterized protein LOC5520216 n=1 Tax=Nematostella vectensis TaxID=45351 RepID=UPI0013906D36|nr:uncharacterized protein LOC5520216 [Nematostella vectensis]
MASLQKESLLNNLNDLVLRLKSSEKQPIQDDHVFLAPICEGIENVLRVGLKRSVLGFGLVKWDYWCWIESLPRYIQNDRRTLALLHGITFTKSSKKIVGYQGYGRLFIRFALSKRLLGHVVEGLQKNKKLLKYWYNETAILCDKVFSDMFRHILSDLEEHNFNLNLKNAYFLDESWVIPELKETQIVPCKELGLVVRHVDNRVIVAHVKSTGAAGDAGIEYGDIMVELLGKSLHKLNNGKVLDLLRNNIGRPVLCILVKANMKRGDIFPPSAARLAVIQADPYKEKNPDDDVAPQQLAGWDETPVHASDTLAAYPAVFYGKLDVGTDGSVAVIEDSIIEVLNKAMPPRDVELLLSEINITVVDKITSKVLSVHSFTETSSCGRRNDRKDLIAFVSGETTCSLAQRFYCYVFQIKDPEVAKVILYSIADGFCRTVWFV